MCSKRWLKNHGNPPYVGTHVVDGSFQLHCMSPDQPVTYGRISEGILTSILSYRSKRIDINFDTYERPFIKDSERKWRGAVVVDHEFTVEGPQQKRSQSFKTMLCREAFKRELPNFLSRDWASDHYNGLLEGHEIYLGVKNECTRFCVEDGIVKTEPVPSLSCNHAETDTRIILNMIHADKTTPSDIVIRGSDTDILVLLLHHLQRVTSTVWMDVGTRNMGNRRYINVTKIAAAIGPSMCGALPGLHAFTGSDYTSAFIRKGKSRPYSIVSNIPRFQTAFSSLCQRVPTTEILRLL